MIAIGLIGMSVFAFISTILRALDERRVIIHNGVWWFVAILLIGSMGLITTGLAIVTWRYLP